MTNFHTRLRGFSRFQSFFTTLAPAGALGLFLLTAPPQTAFAQTNVNCTTSNTTTLAARTGLAEKMGNVVINCTGGSAGTAVAGDIFVTMSANVTNSLDMNGNLQFITVSGAGAAVTSGIPVLVTPTVLQIPNVSYTVPTPNSSPVSISLGGIRAAVASIQNGSSTATVTASPYWVGFNVASAPVNVATSTIPLLSTVQNQVVPCGGSPLPSTMDFPSFVQQGTTSSAVRITEAYAGAFATLDATATNGVRIIVQLSGYPSGAQVYVPSALVGNSGSVPTSGGEFGLYAAGGGQYTPYSGQLLLSLVTGADQNGAGGILVYYPPVAAGTFTAMTQLTLSGGSAYAVYEVIDQNPNALESVQIPVFEASSAYSCASPPPPVILSAMEAPISAVAMPTMTDPIPRYIASALTSDCQVVGDCSAGYNPILSVNLSPVNLAGASAGVSQTGFISVLNYGGSALSFTVSTSYQAGSNWLTVTPTAADDGSNATLTLTANPATLQPGTYMATVTINAGAAGTASVPVSFVVGPAGPTIQGIVNAASFQTGAIAPGSYAALFGTNLSGANVSVLFNGSLTATVISDSAAQINLIVPSALAGQPAATVLVAVGGGLSNSFTVTLAANEPGVFTPGILNSDSTVNTAANPATRGTFVQVYLTGLATPVAAGTVSVNMGSQTGIVPLYAGAQGTLAALDQINVTVPAGLAFTGNSTPLQVCVTSLVPGQPICSNAVSLYVQ